MAEGTRAIELGKGEIVMTSTTYPSSRLSPLAAAFGLAAALVVLFVICAVVQMVAPDLPATHAWIGLFTAADAGSVRAWLEGLFYSIVFGAVAGAVFVVGYNTIAGRGA
jgi:hypothetical protein